ncbi:MAG: hypothetical protein ACI4WY_09115 [Anaerovoracaceae bacterium]
MNRNKLILALVTVFTAAMVLFPQVTEAGSKSAIIIWANSIVPVLLPFFIFSDFIKRTGNLEKLPPRIYPFAVACLSGYPMGARVSADMVKTGALCLEDGKWVLSYAMVTGPAFLMGTIGGFLGSTRAAAVVTAAHYGAALLNGFFWKTSPGTNGRRNGKNHKLPGKNPGSAHGAAGLLDSFTQSILSGFRAMALILAYLILFMIGMQLLDAMGLFRLIGNEAVCSLLKGLLEMTAGSSMVSACNISLQLKSVLITVLVSFGGLSVIGQSVSMAEGSGIGMKDILQRKATHGLLAGILAVFLAGIMI